MILCNQRIRKRDKWRLPLAASLLICGALSAPVLTPQMTQEEDLKAALLLSFVRFTEWPSASADTPITIGVWNQSSLQSALEKLVANKTVNGRPILIRGLKNSVDLKLCQMAYFGSLSGKKLQEVLLATANSGLLTVGEDERFLQSGGTIHLFEDDGRMSFEVQMSTLSQIKLNISSKLLRLGYTVGNDRRGRVKQ